MMEWIKVEDRFPPACQTILVYGRQYGSKSVLPTVYTTYTGTRPRETVEDEEITAWMPLPKPPAM